MSNKTLLLLALGIASLAAAPAEAAQYFVTTQVDGTRQPEIVGSDAPTTALFGDVSTASVQLGFVPLPSVMATSQTSAPNTVFVDGGPVGHDSMARGEMVYGFQLSGSPDSTLNLLFSGSFRMLEARPVDGINQVSGPAANYGEANQADVSLNINTQQATTLAYAIASWHLSNNLYGDSVYAQSSNSKVMSSGSYVSSSTNIALNQAGYGYQPEFSGSFQGSVQITLDHNGYARGVVDLMADAVENASAFIDPYLSIDPAYLQLHPEASLSFEPGVGNTAPVPEPASAALCLGGLGLLALRWQRRQRRLDDTDERDFPN